MKFEFILKGIHTIKTPGGVKTLKPGDQVEVLEIDDVAYYMTAKDTFSRPYWKAVKKPSAPVAPIATQRDKAMREAYSDAQEAAEKLVAKEISKAHVVVEENRKRQEEGKKLLSEEDTPIEDEFGPLKGTPAYKALSHGDKCNLSKMRKVRDEKPEKEIDRSTPSLADVLDD